MILLLSVLILVHEAGHFLAAKMFKMKVARFGFGLPIGPTLWEKQIGDVKVLVHAFLLGGYVAFPDDDKELNLPADSPDRFMNRPIYQRFVVVSAGVFANVVCAFVLVFLTAALWGQMPSGKYDIYVKDIVAAKEASIWQSGLEKGDKILKINGINATTTAAPIIIAQLSKENDGKVNQDFANKNLEKLKKLNQTFTQDEIIPKDMLIKLPAKEYESAITINENVLKGLEKYNDTEVKLSDKQLKLRDSIGNKNYIISDGETTLKDVSFAISDNVHPINMEVLRNGETISLNPIYPSKEGLMGIQMEVKEIVIPTKGPKAIIKTSINYLWEQTSMLLYGLYQIFTGKIPLKDLHGIVAITKVGGDIIEHNGFFSGLLLTAIISLDLAIVNFLPIPALDGGHVLFLLYEIIARRKPSDKFMEYAQMVGMFLLFALLIWANFNDIMRFLF